MCGNTERPWRTRPRPRAARRSAVIPVTSSPAKTTRPRDGRSTPAIALTSVDLPAPLAPSTQTVSSASTASETSCRTGTAPQPAVRLSTVRSGGMAQVRLDDARVALDVGGGPRRDLLAVVEDDDRVADVHDGADVVLDDEEGLAAGAHVAEEAEVARDLALGEAGEGLVEHVERGLRPHQHEAAQLEDPLLPVRQARHRRLAEVAEAEEL